VKTRSARQSLCFWAEDADERPHRVNSGGRDLRRLMAAAPSTADVASGADTDGNKLALIPTAVVFGLADRMEGLGFSRVVPIPIEDFARGLTGEMGYY